MNVAIELISALKAMLVKVANLQNVDPEKIEDHLPLFGEGLGLDSIDMLEIVVHVENTYGLKIRNDADGRKALGSVAELADAITKHQAQVPCHS